ncbi:MAG: lipoyl synthase, partial [Sedimenticola sp.]|nr:lipoyl synthase [Sedimenticola sp.]
MSNPKDINAPSRATPETHQRGSEKLARIPVKVEQTQVMPRKPSWIRVKMPTGERVNEIKKILRQSNLSSVCEEAACPNLGECFSHGTATFMIMGDICTRRCPFCDVAHGKPLPLDQNEPTELAEAVRAMRLRYVVITSVDRDDLRDGGAGHFVACIEAVRKTNPD